MKNEEHLPVFGIGLFLVFPILMISVLSLIFSIKKTIPRFELEELKFIFIIIGIILILIGIALWTFAVMKSRITKEILDNNLVTSGVYSYVRHPIYSAFLFMSSGIIIFSQNIFLFFLPIIYWAILSIGMIRTEEKWLLEKFGDSYVDYSKKANRFITFIKRVC